MPLSRVLGESRHVPFQTIATEHNILPCSPPLLRVTLLVSLSKIVVQSRSPHANPFSQVAAVMPTLADRSLLDTCPSRGLPSSWTKYCPSIKACRAPSYCVKDVDCSGSTPSCKYSACCAPSGPVTQAQADQTCQSYATQYNSGLNQNSGNANASKPLTPRVYLHYTSTTYRSPMVCHSMFASSTVK